MHQDDAKNGEAPRTHARVRRCSHDGDNLHMFLVQQVSFSAPLAGYRTAGIWDGLFHHHDVNREQVSLATQPSLGVSNDLSRQ